MILRIPSELAFHPPHRVPLYHWQLVLFISANGETIDLLSAVFRVDAPTNKERQYRAEGAS